MPQFAHRCRTPARCFTLFLLGLPVLLTGCASNSWGAVGLRDDVVTIKQFIPTYPWIHDDEGRSRGLQARVYFVSAETEKGVHVPGRISVDLNVLHPQPQGGYEREQVYRWEFSESEAAGFRVRTRAVLGYSYGFVLCWPDDIDLSGEEVQLTFRYHRQEGGIVERRGPRFRVPLPPGYTSPPRAAQPTPARQPAESTGAAPRANSNGQN